MVYDVIVIGAGAAGLMCAAQAGKRGRKVLVLEKANKVGKKILMSGGGKCKFLYPSSEVAYNVTLPIIVSNLTTTFATIHTSSNLRCRNIRSGILLV